MNKSCKISTSFLLATYLRSCEIRMPIKSIMQTHISRWIYVLLAFGNVNIEHCGYWMKTKVDCWILVNVEYWSWTWERQLLDSYSSISRRATTVPYVVDQSATKSEKGGVALRDTLCLLSFGRKKNQKRSFIGVYFDDLSNIRKLISLKV